MSNEIIDILNDMVDEGHFERIVSKSELLYNRKIWNRDILIEGGVSYYYPTKSDNVELKDRYRVAMTYKREHTKKFKYGVKLANGEIFSVAAKSMGESQAVVNQLFGIRLTANLRESKGKL